MQVEEFLEFSARRMPEKTALVCGDVRLSYGEIDRLANRLAHCLRTRGLRRGDRVAIFLDNCVETVVSLFAILKAGGTLVCVDPAAKLNNLRYILNDCGATALVADAGKPEIIVQVAQELPRLKTIFFTGAAMLPSAPDGSEFLHIESAFSDSSFSEQAPSKKNIDADLAALIYTSGSTGKPKGVMLTHLNMVSASNSVITYLENNSDDVILSVMSLSYSYGLYQVLSGFHVGARVVLERSIAYPQLVLEKIQKERVTGLPLVPTIAALLLQYDMERYASPTLRYVTTAGSAISEKCLQELRRRLPHARIFSMYGQTECKRVSYLPPDQIDRHPGSVGIAIPNEEVLIVDEHGHEVAPGQVGELVVRGSHVMKGYWNLAEETKRALRPGALPGESVLYTGDLFRMDEEGFLYFVGRKDNIIKTRGQKVSPVEVEAVLCQFEGVAEVAVVAVPDEILGQAIKALIVPQKDRQIGEKDVRAFCAHHLEDYKVPKWIDFRDTLPKTSSGKIDRKTLVNVVESKA